MKPQRKVVAGGMAGALSSLIIWSLQQIGIEVPAEQAVAVTTLLTFVISYLVPNAQEKPNA